MLKAGFLLSPLFLLSACSTTASDLTISSNDGAWLLSTSGSPQHLTISNTEQNQVFRQYTVDNNEGTAARITCLIEAPSRQSFIAVLADAQEIWEMSYDSDADPVFPGFVHNYRPGQVEGITVEEQPFARRRLNLELNHSTLVFSPDFTEVIGYSHDGRLLAYNLDSRKVAGRLGLQKRNLLMDSQFVESDNELVFILELEDGQQQVFSTRNWHAVDSNVIELNAPVAFESCTQQSTT